MMVGEIPEIITVVATTLNLFSAPVTAFATAVLAFLTYVLAKATARMAAEYSRSQIVATLEPNQWSVIHFDLIVANTGNASAFDITIRTDPPLVSDLPSRGGEAIINDISILRPGQVIRVYASEYAKLDGKRIDFSVEWGHRPGSKRREHLKYSIDMNNFKGIGSLGSSTPAVQIAEQIKKIREDWQAVARGNRRLRVDTYPSSDRVRQDKEAADRIAAMARGAQSNDTDGGAS